MKFEANRFNCPRNANPLDAYSKYKKRVLFFPFLFFFFFLFPVFRSTLASGTTFKKKKKRIIRISSYRSDLSLTTRDRVDPSSGRSRILHGVEWKNIKQRIRKSLARAKNITSKRRRQPRGAKYAVSSHSHSHSLRAPGSKTPTRAHVHSYTHARQYIQRHPREKENIFVDARSSERCYAPITHVY